MITFSLLQLASLVLKLLIPQGRACKAAAHWVIYAAYQDKVPTMKHIFVTIGPSLFGPLKRQVVDLYGSLPQIRRWRSITMATSFAASIFGPSNPSSFYRQMRDTVRFTHPDVYIQ